VYFEFAEVQIKADYLFLVAMSCSHDIAASHQKHTVMEFVIVIVMVTDGTFL